MLQIFLTLVSSNVVFVVSPLVLYSLMLQIFLRKSVTLVNTKLKESKEFLTLVFSDVVDSPLLLFSVML